MNKWKAVLRYPNLVYLPNKINCKNKSVDVIFETDILMKISYCSFWWKRGENVRITWIDVFIKWETFEAILRPIFCWFYLITLNFENITFTSSSLLLWIFPGYHGNWQTCYRIKVKHYKISVSLNWFVKEIHVEISKKLSWYLYNNNRITQNSL